MAEEEQFDIDGFYDALWSEESQSKAVSRSNSLEDFKSITQRYDKIAEIGRGSMKKVFRVYDHFTCRELALAELIEPQNPEMLELFFHEARLTSQLDHPNIIQVHDISLNENSEPYYTMDLKVGKSLDELCKEKLNQNEALEYFIKICSAISYAHSKDIIHLDLKPENIQIGQYGELIICDWGLGSTNSKLSLEKACEEEFYQGLILSKPSKRKVTGTPGFMAPEQYLEEDLNDDKSDIFSLGAILYFMLSKQAPFSGSIEEIKEQTFATDFPSPSSINNTVPEALEAICLKAMQVNKTERYQSVEKLLEDLKKFRTGHTTSAEKTGFFKETTRLIQRNKVICSALLLSLSLILIITLLFFKSLKESHALEQEARRNSEKVNKLYEKEKFALSQALTLETENLRDHFTYRNPVFATTMAIEKTKALLRTSPDDPSFNRILLHLYITSFKFEKALRLVNEATDKNLDFPEDYIIFLRNLDKDLVKNSRPNVSELIRVFQDLREHCQRRKNLMAKMFLHDYYARKLRTMNKEHYSQVIFEILLTLNPNWQSPQFIYKADDSYLKISGKGFSTFLITAGNHDVNFLDHLGIKELDLSDTDVFSPSQFRQFNKLESLDISNTLINQSLSFRQLPELTSLKLSSKQAKLKAFRKVPKKLSIVIIDELKQ